MKPPKRSQYPKYLVIKDQAYHIKFQRKIGSKQVLGECDPSDYEIRIKVGQGRKEAFKTLIHEMLHALEFEYSIKLKHKTIYRLEKALARLLLDNF